MFSTAIQIINSFNNRISKPKRQLSNFFIGRGITEELTVDYNCNNYVIIFYKICTLLT